MLPRYCLIHISIIILRDFWYLRYLCPCLGPLFKKYKKTRLRLHGDKEIYKRAWYSVQNLIAKKKRFFENKLKEYIGKPKDLWKAIKSLGLPNKSGGCIVGALAENQIVKHDTKSILKTLAKLPKSPNRYTIKFVSDYYKKLSLSENFKLDLNNWRLLTKFQENF